MIDQERIRQFIDAGEAPTLQEYKDFCQVMEYASPDILWRMMTKCTKLHWSLQSVIKSKLHEKILKEKSAESDERFQKVYEALKTRFE